MWKVFFFFGEIVFGDSTSVKGGGVKKQFTGVKVSWKIFVGGIKYVSGNLCCPRALKPFSATLFFPRVLRFSRGRGRFKALSLAPSTLEWDEGRFLASLSCFLKEGLWGGKLCPVLFVGGESGFFNPG